MDTIELPPFQANPPRLDSERSSEGGNHHAGRVTRAFQPKIPEKAPKNTDFHSTPGSDLCRHTGRTGGMQRLTSVCPFKLSCTRSSLAQDIFDRKKFF